MKQTMTAEEFSSLLTEYANAKQEGRAAYSAMNAASDVMRSPKPEICKGEQVEEFSRCRRAPAPVRRTRSRQ